MLLETALNKGVQRVVKGTDTRVNNKETKYLREYRVSAQVTCICVKQVCIAYFLPVLHDEGCLQKSSKLYKYSKPDHYQNQALISSILFCLSYPFQTAL